MLAAVARRRGRCHLETSVSKLRLKIRHIDMAPSIKTEAIERLARERARRGAGGDLPARLDALSRHLRAAYDTRPVSKAEWDEASGDEAA